MDIDQRAPIQKPNGDDEETDDEDEERSTPQPLEDEEEEQAEEERFKHLNTDEETATDDDDDQPEQKEESTTMRKPSPPRQHKPAGQSSKPTAPDLKTQSKETTPPPRRELPFSRRGARTGAQADASTPVVNDERVKTRWIPSRQPFGSCGSCPQTHRLVFVQPNEATRNRPSGISWITIFNWHQKNLSH